MKKASKRLPDDEIVVKEAMEKALMEASMIIGERRPDISKAGFARLLRSVIFSLGNWMVENISMVDEE